MLTFVANIPIFRRLFYAFLLAAVVPGMIVAIQGIAFANEQSAHSQAMHTSIAMKQATTAVQVDLQNLNSSLNAAYQDQYESNAIVQARTPDLLKSTDVLTRQTGAALKRYQQSYQLTTAPGMSGVLSILTSNDPSTTIPVDQQHLLTGLQTRSWPAYRGVVEQVLHGIAVQAPVAELRGLLMQADQQYAPIIQAWQKIDQIADSVSNSIALPSQVNAITLTTVIAFLSTIMVVVAIGYVVNLTITRPLSELANLTKRISRGETTARARIGGRDEIYMVANSMNSMLDNIVLLIQQTQLQRDLLQAQVEKLVSEVSGIGEGDLRVQAEVTADALGVLADSFNYMVEELGGLVVRVKKVAAEVEKFTTTILDRMTSLVETGDIQIHQIEAAALEVEHMAASSRQVAERSQVLYEVAREARKDAQIGRESLTLAVQGIGRISENVQATASKVQSLGEHSREINEIVDAISGIAHQTNRLALDAAIQAAMAGDHGKGFGAVAADIRRLAERAKEQANTVTRIVRNVREEIGAVAVSMQDTERETTTGARLTQEAGIALESIFAAVEHQAREIENINQMTAKQLQSSGSVVQIMQEISETMRSSSASTRKASQHMERLALLVEQLRSSVEAFKLRENQEYVPASGINIALDDEPENPLTVSGVLRTISATAAQLSAVPGAATGAPSHTLLPERNGIGESNDHMVDYSIWSE
jgi:methyl-accepting chemotaxis protein